MSRRGILKTLLATPLAALFGPKIQEEAKVFMGADTSMVSTETAVAKIFWKEVGETPDGKRKTWLWFDSVLNEVR